LKPGITRKTSYLLMSCLCLLLVLSSITAEAAPPGFAIGQKLRVPGLNIPQEASILAVEQGDVTGDQTNDTILLVGQPLQDNPSFYTFLTVVVRDGKTGKFSTLPDGKVKAYLRGYEPALFLGDFTGDKTKDVMVSVVTGGSGGTSNYLIATWNRNRPQIIFGENENAGLRIKGKYLDGFKAELYSEVLKKTFLVDVSGLKKGYIEANVYDASGKLIYVDPNPKNPYDIFSDPFSSLTPVDADGDGVYELRGQQSVWGPFHYLTFTTVESYWKYKNGKWDVTDASYTLRYGI
jgi:hypothetical protein